MESQIVFKIFTNFNVYINHNNIYRPFNFHNVLFNAEKYQLLHYPVRGGKQLNGIYHNNIYIKCVKDSLHLGHIIGLNVKSKTIQHAVNSFNTSLNGILNYFSLANVTVKYKLFKSFACCYMVLCYGI